MNRVLPRCTALTTCTYIEGRALSIVHNHPPHRQSSRPVAGIRSVGWGCPAATCLSAHFAAAVLVPSESHCLYSTYYVCITNSSGRNTNMTPCLQPSRAETVVAITHSVANRLSSVSANLGVQCTDDLVSMLILPSSRGSSDD